VCDHISGDWRVTENCASLDVVVHAANHDRDLSNGCVQCVEAGPALAQHGSCSCLNHDRDNAVANFSICYEDVYDICRCPERRHGVFRMGGHKQC
jgi:hypothetical protein